MVGRWVKEGFLVGLLGDHYLEFKTLQEIRGLRADIRGDMHGITPLIPTLPAFPSGFTLQLSNFAFEANEEVLLEDDISWARSAVEALQRSEWAISRMFDPSNVFYSPGFLSSQLAKTDQAATAILDWLDQNGASTPTVLIPAVQVWSRAIFKMCRSLILITEGDARAVVEAREAEGLATQAIDLLQEVNANVLQRLEALWDAQEADSQASSSEAAIAELGEGGRLSDQAIRSLGDDDLRADQLQPVEALAQLTELHERGLITQDEFTAKRRAILRRF